MTRQFTTRPEIIGTFGVVASTHWLATAAGMRMLEIGGNAFDAAVATAFALQVVQPHLVGLGGEVPIIFYDAERLESKVLCGQGTTPAAASIQKFTDLGLDVIPGSGFLAACVPGAFGAWMLLLRDHGVLSLREVLSPAVEYALNGYALHADAVATIKTVSELFRKHWPSSAETYLPNGIPEPESLFYNRDLAHTYQKLIAAGEAAGADRAHQIEAARRAFYDGFVAEAIERFVGTFACMDTSRRHHTGLLTAHDMSNWHATYEEPVGLDYHGFRILKAGPWTQGPVLLQQLALLKGFDLQDLDPCGEEFVHLVTECSKLAFADREKFYGDPDFCDVPLETLLGEPYNAWRRSLIGQNASLEFRPGHVDGFDAEIPYRTPDQLAEEEKQRGAGEPTQGVRALGAVRGDTVHFDVIDRFGNFVSATPSGGWLQSSPIIPGLGFCLGTRAQMFWLKPGLPTSLAPRKRPRTTLTVNMVQKDGAPFMVFGTPGGDQQDQWNTVFLLRQLHHDLTLQQNMDMPMFHNHHMPSSFFPRTANPGKLTIEKRFGDDVIGKLRARGHLADVAPDWSLGYLTAASKTGARLKAAATPRHMQCYAFGR